MRKKSFLWLSFLAVFSLILYSCRNDYLSEQSETYSNSIGFQLTSKRISLNESKHKAKLLPEIEKVKAEFKAKLKSNVFGKTVSYGDGVSINTDDVIYIENGPNYHTYTFRIERENAPENAPVENLLLSPLPDGSYQEFLVTYNLTPQEKEKIRNGEAVNTKGKTTITELAKGSFNSGGQLTQAKTTCYWTDVTIVYGCSQINSSTGNSVHHAGNMSDWHNCTAETKPIAITAGVWNCGMEGEDNYISPGNQPGIGPGGEGTGSGTTPDDCTTVASNPGEVGIVNPNGCNTGVPTLPNLGGNPKNTPCEKTKKLLSNPKVKEKIDSLYDKSKKGGEKAFMVTADGTTGPLIPGGEHSVHLGDITGYQGYYHNHTPKGVKMLSPPDIYKLFQFIASQPAGTPVEASFGAMVVAQEGCMSGCPDSYLYFTYLIRFKGTLADAIAIKDRNYTEADLKILKDQFEEFEQRLRPKTGYSSQYGNFMSFKGLEEVFYNALEDMKINKNQVILQRIDKDGKVTNVVPDANGKPKDIPCPQ